MVLKHNKKRNIGLLSEFFAQSIASAMINNRLDYIDLAQDVWRKHVLENPNLKTELRMYEAMYKSHLKNRDVAFELLKKIKAECIKQSQTEIDGGKTKLLHEVRNTLKDTHFFERNVENYRIGATIQILLNAWRDQQFSSVLGSVKLSKLEDQVLEHMVSEKPKLEPVAKAVLNSTSDDIDRLVVNVFREKMEKKYSHLSDEQKQLIGLYVFSSQNENSKKQLVEKLKHYRHVALSEIDKEIEKEKLPVPKNKLLEVKKLLVEGGRDIYEPTDETISLYLAVTKLMNELKAKETNDS